MRIRKRLAIVRGAPRVHRNLPWTLGELAYFTIDRDDAARSCPALRFHALPVHVRKSSPNGNFA